MPPVCGSKYAGGVTFQLRELRSICTSSSSTGHTLVMLDMCHDMLVQMLKGPLD
jgi:hypothetical protein